MKTKTRFSEHFRCTVPTFLRKSNDINGYMEVDWSWQARCCKHFSGLYNHGLLETFTHIPPLIKLNKELPKGS